MRTVRSFWLFLLFTTMVFSSCDCSKEPAPVDEAPIFPERRVGFHGEQPKRTQRMAAITPSPRPEVDEEEDDSRDALDRAEIPEDFPDEVPIYKDAELNKVMPIASGAQTVLFSTTDSVDDVTSYYHNEMADAGWQVTQEFQRDAHSFATFKKGDLQMNLTIAEDSRNPGKQIISIMYETVAPLPFDPF